MKVSYKWGLCVVFATTFILKHIPLEQPPTTEILTFGAAFFTALFFLGAAFLALGALFLTGFLAVAFLVDFLAGLFVDFLAAMVLLLLLYKEHQKGGEMEASVHGLPTGVIILIIIRKPVINVL